jgi:2,3-dihydroxyphenylpropionate 1,2-dioxygenase
MPNDADSPADEALSGLAARSNEGDVMPVQLKCLSHTPLRGANDPAPGVVQEVDAMLAKARAEVEAFDPELIVLFGPDHYRGLFYDLMPQFVLATAAVSDEDYGCLPGPLSIPKELAMQLHRFLLDNDIDMAVSHRMVVDHGCTQTLAELSGSLTRYPVIPIIIYSVAPPFCSYRRIRKLGEVVGRFIASLGNKRVLIVGTGGLSHEPPVPLLVGAPDDVANFLTNGRNLSPEARKAREANTIAAGKIYGTPASTLTPLNPEWDLAFIDTLVQGRLAEVDAYKVEEISRVAGRSTHEVRTWVAAFSALAACGPYEARKDYYRAINEWIAGYGAVSARSK